MAAVNRNMFDASVHADQTGNGAAVLVALPLNLVAHIVSFIEEPGDLARMCRTCRLFNYMALPHLYRNISLTSYNQIRYRNEQPEGWGSASPFLMGLDVLVTKPQAALVRSLTLRGEWKEPDLEEHSRVGRVPESSMVLNIAVRAALERTVNIRSFSWDLNTKLLETVYLGLSQLSKLTSLSIRFPTSRHPRPIYEIPAMPHLRSLRVTDIDPLCYPDDISTLLAKSRRLRELALHWSPRMREFQEPSVIVHDYFRQCTAENLPMKLRKVAFYNFYARRTIDMNAAIQEDMIEDMTFINNANPGTEDSPYYLSFVDRTWLLAGHPSSTCSWKSIRHDTLTKEFCEFLASVTSLERLYFVNPARIPAETMQSPRQTGGQLISTSNSTSNPTGQILNGAIQSSAMTSISGISRGGSAASSPHSPSANPSPILQLRDSFFIPIITSNGATLRHLVLPSRWPLSTLLIARLVRVCPNLEQLAMAPEVSAMESFQLLIPFLRKLSAMRILVPPGEKPSGIQPLPTRPTNGSSPTPFISLSELADLDERLHIEKISALLADKDTHGNLKVTSLGHKAYELGEFYQIPASEASPSAEPMELIEEHARDTTVVVPGYPGPGTGSPLSGNLPTLLTRQPHRSPNTPAPGRSANGQRSALGKRSWEEASSPNAGADPQPEFTLVWESDNIYETLPSGEKIAWRRRVRPASSEVLKKWEIFALDSQDVEPFD
ncbi:hypothetical protein PISL3812_01746 [Talaromyces islandicus]|uniref:F-box domain-containing protein n=1 Tax=Talaromyces islandicus TaxID=28573 RepID=A0A0U1LMY6_TALIS|nr:hypothetical protein PISL3812_01746 [Talaromyces islandicus]